MADLSGRFVWYELLTTDAAAACDFYSKVVGWQPQKTEMPGGGMDYWMLRIDGAEVAGAMAQPDAARQMGAPPAWLGYVGVDDVDATAGRVKAGGGQVFMGPMDIPEVGRFAVVADPAGAVIGIFKSAHPEQERPQQQSALGRVGWHELHGGEVGPSFDFYSRIFGWEKKDSMDMGAHGEYRMFGVGDATLGGMMKNPADSPAPPHWNYYFNVGNIDQAVDRAKSAGGQIMLGPMEVPGGDWVAMGMDPQGAAFALLGHR